MNQARGGILFVDEAYALAGRNAERVFLGENATGCWGDFEDAKAMARQMVHEYAMGELGRTTEAGLLLEADERATQILLDNKYFITELALPALWQLKVLPGELMIQLYVTYRRDGLDDAKAYLKSVTPSVRLEGERQRVETV